MVGIIEGYRSVLLNRPVDFASLGISALAGAVCLYTGLKFFCKTEGAFADII